MYTTYALSVPASGAMEQAPLWHDTGIPRDRPYHSPRTYITSTPAEWRCRSGLCEQTYLQLRDHIDENILHDHDGRDDAWQGQAGTQQRGQAGTGEISRAGREK